MDELLRASAWGWTEVVLQAIRAQPFAPSPPRAGWRSHLLRAQSIHTSMDPALWRDAEVQEPRLHGLLASLIGPNSEQNCERRLQVGTAGLRADAACDRSWLALSSGDYAKAEFWATRAREILPQHAEARRWNLLLQSIPLPSCTRTTGRFDQKALYPRAVNAWLSPERWRRRGLSGRWTRPASSECALFTLQERGVHTRHMAPESFWMASPLDHPAIELESLVDEIQSQARSLRIATATAWKAWELASRLGARWVSALSCFLARRALHEPSLLQIGLLASGVACRLHPTPPDWHAIRARLLAECGQRQSALREARRLLDAPEPTVHAMAIETLNRLGHHREAQRASRTSPKRSFHHRHRHSAR